MLIYISDSGTINMQPKRKTEMKPLTVVAQAPKTLTDAAQIQICVYDGYMDDYDPPKTVVAASSDGTGLGIPPPYTGTVTHQKNAVGYSYSGSAEQNKVYLYVDGKRFDFVQSGKLLEWNVGKATGPHTLKGMFVDAQDVEQFSPEVTVQVATA